MFEMFLLKKYITVEEWNTILKTIAKYNGFFKWWKLILEFEGSYLHYYVKTVKNIPTSINKIDNILFKETTDLNNTEYSKKNFIMDFNNILDIREKIKRKNDENVKRVEINLCSSFKEKLKYHIHIITDKTNYTLLFNNPENLISINFENNYNIIPKSSPKYLDISKNLSMFETNNLNCLFEVDTFPYIEGKFYLNQFCYEFNRHSLVVGSSGSGKSKFLSLLVKNTLNSSVKYKIVIIDPHASLEDDIGGLGNVIDFSDKESSIDLFASDTDIIINVELLIELLENLIGKNNSKVERVLRHSLYLLLLNKCFNFNNLRRIILDIEYRNSLIDRNKIKVPINVIEFFASEFNDIKTKSYMDAISPIISLVDEMTMIPVFNEDALTNNLYDTILNNDLNIFSLDRTKLGDKITKTISGLIMQQLLTLVQKRRIDEHIIFIVDEVAVVENPILSRFLSEARKYNLSLILAGQYFKQISDELKSSIFANVLNYYIFRVSKSDAEVLSKNISMKIPLSDTEDAKIKMLTDLKNRECIVRINKNGMLMPSIKGITLDFIGIPRIKKLIKEDEVKVEEQRCSSKINFKINSKVNMKDILKKSSSSRKEINDERETC